MRLFRTSNRLFRCVFICTIVMGGFAIMRTAVNAGDHVYRNPFELDNEWAEYGIGDPFILRWNGMYYMYPSTNTHFGGSIGIRVWQSEDLVHWKYAGNVTAEVVTHNAYAPEVVYWNGYFYMYTSPGGQGHYVLRSDNPLGPFTVQTDNLGMSIDGSVFIDDDGRWYFTHAGHLGIRGRSMADPYTMGPEHVLNSDLGGWTEGSFIMKRNGYYYLTYTGNHLLSTGYRVHYSVAEDGPLGPYTVPDDSLLLISTKEDFSGLGHSATVLGPDLDSYYIVYHSMPKRIGPHIRKMNIDRLAFNGRKMVVLGPTNYDQPVPKRPDFYTWIDEDGLDAWDVVTHGDRELLLSERQTAGNFTAEFNFSLRDLDADERVGQVGAVFSYVNADNFAYALIDLRTRRLMLFVVENGVQRELASAPLLDDTDFTVLHTIRVVKAHDTLQVYVDNLLRLDTAGANLPEGKMGYVYTDVRPVFRFTAFSNNAGGSADFDAAKPIPGTIEAVHYRESDGYLAAQGATHNNLRPGDGTHIYMKDDGSHYVALETGHSLTYNVNVAATSLYGVAMMVHTESDALLEATVNDKIVGTWVVSPENAGSTDSVWMKVRVGEAQLPQGLHELHVRVVEGRASVEYVEMFLVATEPFAISADLTDGTYEDWSTYGARAWSITESGYRAVERADTMAIIGHDAWTDYRVAVDLQTDALLHPGEAGVLLRATHPSYMEGQTKDPVIAYYVVFDGEQLSLRKLQYDSRPLAQANVGRGGPATHRLVVDVVGSTITVYWDDLERPVIEYTDFNGLMYGAVGLRSNTGGAAFRNLDITCLACPVYGKVNIGHEQIWLQPARDRATIRLPFAALQPPSVQITGPKQLASAEVIDPDARIYVEGPAAIPGEATIRIADAAGRIVHTVRVNLVKETVPAVRLALNDENVVGYGWGGTVRGLVSVAVHADGPDELIRHVRVTAGYVQAGEITDTWELYAGPGVPPPLLWNTAQFADGTYELGVTVQSVYGTERTINHRVLVENRVVLIDDLEPPVDSWFGLLSRRKTISETDGWQYATATSEQFFGDAHRLVPTTVHPESLTWEARGLEGFSITLYSTDYAIEQSVLVHVSDDGQRWVSLPYVVASTESSPEGWLRLQLKGKADEAVDANLFRITLQGGEEPGSVQLGQVRLTALLSD